MVGHITSSETSPLFQGQRGSRQQTLSSSAWFSMIVPRWDLIVMIIYFTAGVAFYSTIEDMPFIRALYFCMITFTTVGFGDFSPSTTLCKLFTCLFVFIGLAIIANLISDLLDYIIEEREKLKKEKLHETFDRQDNVLDHGNKNDLTECFTLFSIEIPPFAVPIVQGMKQSVLIISLNILIGVLFYSYLVDNFSLLDSFYLSCMTITTVGYGDIAPKNNYSRAFTIVYALLGTLMTGNALSRFANAVSDYKQAQLEATVLARPLNHASLLAMDTDRDAKVSKEEFVLYKLKVMGALDEDIVCRAESQFHRLDVTKSGSLSIADIVSFEEKIDDLHNT